MRRQAGFSLMEAMISLALSVVVTSAMVALMGNSMGTATRIIQMTQLSDELRNVMSLMSRDVRRANYNPDALYCYGDPNCDSGLDLDVISYSGNDCLRYFLERDPAGDSPKVYDGGAFRLNPNSGAIEMWAADSAPPTNCGGSSWVELTDPAFVEITLFNVDDDAGSFSSSREVDGTTFTQRNRQVQMQIEGRLILEPSITRRIEDIIKVRNDLVSASSP